jgi:hypothetical protein
MVADIIARMYTPQAGIFALGTPSHAYLEFDILDAKKHMQIRKQREARSWRASRVLESDSAGLCWFSASFLLCRQDVAKLGFVLPHAPFRALDQRRQLGLKRFEFGSTHRLLHANRSIQFSPAAYA